MKAVESENLNGTKAFDIKMILEAPSIGLGHCIEDKIEMELVTFN